MSAIKAAIAGKIMTLLGYDGANFQNVKVDADGKVFIVTENPEDHPVLIYGDVEGNGVMPVMVAPTGELVCVLGAEFENHVVCNGYTGADFYPLLIDAARHLQIDVVSSALPAGAATWAYQVQTMGFIGTPATPKAGTVNKRLETLHTDIESLLPYYRGRVMLRSFDDDAGLGTNLILIPGPVGSEVWVINTMSAVNMTSGTTSSCIGLFDGSVYYYLHSAGALAAFAGLSWSGEAVVTSVEDLAFIFRGCAVGDDLLCTAFGYVRKP